MAFDRLRFLWATWKTLDKLEREFTTMDAKPFWKSKTLWVNLATIIVQYAVNIPEPYGMYVLALANIILRLLTDRPLKIAVTD